MHQIAIGSAGNRNVFTVIHGASVSAPALKPPAISISAQIPSYPNTSKLNLKALQPKLNPLLQILLLIFTMAPLPVMVL